MENAVYNAVEVIGNQFIRIISVIGIAGLCSAKTLGDWVVDLV